MFSLWLKHLKWCLARDKYHVPALTSRLSHTAAPQGQTPIGSSSAAGDVQGGWTQAVPTVTPPAAEELGSESRQLGS